LALIHLKGLFFDSKFLLVKILMILKVQQKCGQVNSQKKQQQELLQLSESSCGFQGLMGLLLFLGE